MPNRCSQVGTVCSWDVEVEALRMLFENAIAKWLHPQSN